MTNAAGSKLKRAVREWLESLAKATTVDAKQQLLYNVGPLFTMFAEHFAELDELVGDIGGAVEEHDKFLEDMDEGEAGIEPELADRLLEHLKAFAGLIETSKAVWQQPEAQMPPQMLIDKAKAVEEIAKLDAENAALLGAVRDARIDEDNPVVSIVNGNEPQESDENDGDDHGADA